MSQPAEKISSRMGNAKRAAILSAVIFPGAGLFFLRHPLRGCIFAIPAALIILLLFNNLLDVALRLNAELQEQVAAGQFGFDLAYMAKDLHSAIFASPSWNEGKWMLLASWLLSIISSYFAGKKMDLANSPQ